MNRLSATLFVALAAMTVGCEKKSETPSGSGTTEPAKASAKPEAAKPEAAPAAPAGGHHGAVIELGNATIGAFGVRASRDQGEIKPGGDAPIDVWLSGSSDKVVAVRFWIGTQDSKGSVKAKADIEDPKEPNHWHTHTEVPNPMPEGSKLWVEIETETGQKAAASFELKS
jgi:hypothetical protein